MISKVSLLENNTRNKIRSLWFEDKSITDIQKELVISDGTWDEYYWNNKQGFRDFIQSIKAEYFIIKAERVSSEILELKAEDNAKIHAIKQKESEFLRETLGKDLGYSKRPDSININVNKNEPLDDEQKARLSNMLKGVKINAEQVLENGLDKGLNGGQDIATHN